MDGIDKQESIVTESMGSNIEIEFIERAVFLFNGEGWGRMDLAARKRVMNYLVDRFDIPLETKTITLPTPFNPTRSPLEEYINKGFRPPKITCGEIKPQYLSATLPSLAFSHLIGDGSTINWATSRQEESRIHRKTDDICKDLEL